MMRLMALGVRRVVVVCLVVVTGLLAAVPAAGAAVSPRIYGGGIVPIASYPWQVAIVQHNDPNAYTGQFCGGVIVDAMHVITAAHCLDRNGNGVPEAGNTRDVVAGMTDLSGPTGSPAQRVQIATWGGMPQYDFASSSPSAYDAALATLVPPGLDTLSPGVRPAVLIGAGVLTPPGESVRVSGWGETDAGTYPTSLYATDLLTVSDNDCQTFYPDEFSATLNPAARATMLCAIAPGKDSCVGDSGGPLTGEDGTLLGLVSWGAEVCASPSGDPGVYTELAEPTIASFIRDFDPVVAGLEYTPPQSTAPPALSGTAKYGETLTCQPGRWTSTAFGEPEVEFAFRATDGLTLRSWSDSVTYTLTVADAGKQVQCVERARDASGASVSFSTPSDAVAGPPVVAPPDPTPPLGPSPAPAPALKSAPKPVDTVAPRTTFFSIRCKARRCTVRVKVSDRGKPVSGVKTVRITVLPARGTARTVTARRTKGGIYQTRFSRVARGTAWFLVATRDVAGNRSTQLTIRHARVR